MRVKRRGARLALCGVLALAGIATSATEASASGWVHWKSKKYGMYLYSRANGNGARFGLTTDSAKRIYDVHLSNGNWLEKPYNGNQYMEVNGSNHHLDTWSCAYSRQKNEQWREIQTGAWPNDCWNLENAGTYQLVDADAASGNLVGVSDSGYGCGPITAPSSVAWK
ncbi:hypothetical protein [Streptomyces herbicida]|uniref:hypothetical protein n=1 Tax=Streptomyces herbicida TaxID=3065675 RepID=UPI00292D2B2B|nr:hypothetical protein [Streptomyces sp. NEAU-HV9]